jgi:hypothetical protein
MRSEKGKIMAVGNEVDVTAETLDRPLTWFRASSPYYATLEERDAQKTSEVAAFWVLADTPEEAISNIERSHTFKDCKFVGELSVPVASTVHELYVAKPIFRKDRTLDALSAHPWGRSAVVLFIENK